jgi:ABC-2 type transport system ATP-binding protein
LILSPADAFIQIRQLGFSYPKSKEAALENINLQIARGEIFGLLGPNGAGKSTLLSILSGVLPLQSGSITMAGMKLPEHAKTIRTLSAVVPQEYAFYPTLSSRENLEFFAALICDSVEKSKARVEYCLEVCHLQKYADKPAKDYSGGLKRRLNLAIGLLGEPKILYLDEPTVGIDTRSRSFILELIKQFRADGVTVIYTSHYLEEIESLCDAVAIINDGKVIYQKASDPASPGFKKGELEKQLLQLAPVEFRA